MIANMMTQHADRFMQVGLHFLWQATAIAALAWAMSYFVLKSPRQRAAVYLGALFLMALAVPATVMVLDNGERVVDDRLSFYYYATGSTPMMVKPMVGKGSVYEIGSTDINGEPLDGGKTYKVTLPAPIPAKDFWSFMLYDNQTRSILETDPITRSEDGR
jgi:hypothetical protein